MKNLENHTHHIENSYAPHTVRDLIKILTQRIEEDPDLTLDSPVMICDYSNMADKKEEFRVHKVNNYGEACLCLFHSLKQEEEEKPKKQFFSTVLGRFDRF